MTDNTNLISFSLIRCNTIPQCQVNDAVGFVGFAGPSDVPTPPSDIGQCDDPSSEYAGPSDVPTPPPWDMAECDVPSSGHAGSSDVPTAATSGGHPSADVPVPFSDVSTPCAPSGCAGACPVPMLGDGPTAEFAQAADVPTPPSNVSSPEPRNADEINVPMQATGLHLMSLLDV